MADFVQTPLNYAVDYARTLANAYPYLSYFPELWAGPNNEKYKPVNGKTVMIPSMTVSGLKQLTVTVSTVNLIVISILKCNPLQ